jgi:hypothetical protein
MTHYLCFTGMKIIDKNICPPTPGKTIYVPLQNYIDEENVKWVYLNQNYQGWPMYRVKNE